MKYFFFVVEYFEKGRKESGESRGRHLRYAYSEMQRSNAQKFGRSKSGVALIAHSHDKPEGMVCQRKI